VAESNLDFYGLQLDSLEWNYTYIIRSVLNGQIRVSLLYYDMPEKKKIPVYCLGRALQYFHILKSL